MELRLCVFGCWLSGSGANCQLKQLGINSYKLPNIITTHNHINLKIIMNTHEITITLERIGQQLQQQFYPQAAEMCRKAQNQLKSPEKASVHSEQQEKKPGDCDQYWELESLKSVCLTKMNNVEAAMETLSLCLHRKPHHSPSHRRLADLYLQQGCPEKALKSYQIAMLYQPDNLHLTQKISQLKQQLLSPANTQISHSQSDLATTEEKQQVTFGSCQVVEMDSEQSDEYFAHIKNELSKLGQNKPKKSILKMSSAIFPKEAPPHFQSSSQAEIKPANLFKSLSIKSEESPSPSKWALPSKNSFKQGEKHKSASAKKEKKKKSVSFSCTEGDSEPNEQ